MGDLMTKWFGQSWRTTLGGILLGVPPVIASAAMTANLPVGKWAGFIMTLSMGLGGLLVGVTAKDKNVSSTLEQVTAASAAKQAEAAKDAGVPNQ